jgi:hypothetical protein
MGPDRTAVPSTSPRPHSSEATGAKVALFALALVVLALVAARREPHPLAELAPDERALLLQRTMDNLELCARHREPALRDFCEAQAVIARALPECGPHCRDLAIARYPSRVPSARP